MADTVDAVAQAIQKLDATGDWTWEKISDATRDLYRRMARAAIDALELTEEWRCIGWMNTSTEKTAWLQHESNGGEVQSRLVSGWVRKDNTKMSDDITDQADRVLRLRWEQPGPDYPEPVPTGLVWLGDWASEYLGGLVAELEAARAEVERLRARCEPQVYVTTPPCSEYGEGTRGEVRHPIGRCGDPNCGGDW